jgi:hypothetical protein
MSRILPQQLRFEVKVSAPTGGKSVDITEFIGDSVTLSVDMLKMAILTFDVKKPEELVEVLRVGVSIEFWGGYIDTIGFYKDRFAPSINFRKLFVGNIRRIYMTYEEDGYPKATMEAIDGSYSIAGYEQNKKFRYPSKDLPQRRGANWPSSNTMKLSQILSCFAADLGIPIQQDFGANIDKVYTLTNPFAQNNISDYAALIALAKANSCYFWSTIEGNDLVYKFVEKSKVVSQSNRFEFVFVSRVAEQFYQGDYLPTGDGRNESTKLKPNQILLHSVTIEEDPAVFGAHITKVTDYDDEGNTKEELISYDETKDEIIYYELDKAKVQAMEKTVDGKQELDKILAMGAFDIPWSIASKFYKEVRIKKGIIDAIDTPLLGITINATCDGNVLIEPQQSYLIHGINRYSSLRQAKTRRYHLKEMTHRWTTEGFFTDLVFRA